MKVNLGGLKSFFLAHGEKIGMAAVAGGVVWMIATGLSTKSLDENKHTQLAQAVQAAKDMIARTTKVNLPSPSVFEPMTTIDPTSWVSKTEYNKPVWPPSTKRADPDMYVARTLEISTGFDPISLVNPNERRDVGKDKPNIDDLREQKEEADTEVRRTARSRDQGGVTVGPDSNIQGVSWVSVMALVPFEEQRESYEKTFENAEEYVPGQDIPNYIGYLIERADVTDGGDPNWQGIPRVPVVRQASVDKLALTYGGNLPPVADQRWTHHILTGQLLPLVGRNFGLEVKHSEIPKMPTPEELRAEQESLRPNETVDPEVEGDTPFGNFGDQGPAGARNARGAMRGRGIGRMGDSGGEEGMGGGMMAGRRGGGMSGGRMGANFPQADNKRYIMLRYFDVSAQPGRRYIYRVRLALSDPNYGVPQRMLTREAAEKNASRKWLRLTEWSQPSPIARVPYPGEILAGKATAPSLRTNAEPKVTMVFKMFDNQEKSEAAVEEVNLYRGSVGNKRGKIDLKDIRDGNIKEQENYPLWTGMTLVDIAGGRKFPGGNDEFVEPSKILVLTKNGKLIVKSQLEDKSAYENFEEDFKNSEATTGGRPRPGGGEGFGGEGFGDFE